jgi:hypothetical protein
MHERDSSLGTGLIRCTPALHRGASNDGGDQNRSDEGEDQNAVQWPDGAAGRSRLHNSTHSNTPA